MQRKRFTRILFSTIIFLSFISYSQAEDHHSSGKIYVIGAGCGDPDLLTLRAISYIKKADALVCMEGVKKVINKYIGNKPILFDPFFQVPRFYRKKHPEVSVKQSIIEADKIYKKNILLIKKYLKKGKTVAVIEPGDPTIYGGWRNWLFPHFKKAEIEIVPGICSFNAANALFRDGTVTKGSIILTEPKALMKNKEMVKNASKSGDTLVIFMALNRIGKLVPLFRRYYKDSTPVYIVYYAGCRQKEKKVKTSLRRVADTIKANRESFMGLIYIGEHLK